MSKHTLGIDLGVRAAHVATLCDERGEVIWSKRRFRNRHQELMAVVDQVGDCDQLTVVMEPTRNAWVPVAAHFMAVGAGVVLVPPERSADLRRYYAKHTKNDRLDSHVLARLPLLHPEGLNLIDSLGPADALKRAVRRRVKLVEYQLASRQRLDSMLDLLGPGYAEALGGARYTKTALVILERYGNPRRLRRLGVNRLTVLMRQTSGGQWSENKATEVVAAAGEAVSLWEHDQLDFDELAWDLGSEVALVRQFSDEISRLEERIDVLYRACQVFCVRWGFMLWGRGVRGS